MANLFDDDIHLFTEAASDSYVIRDTVYIKVHDVLKTPVGDKRFQSIIGGFIDRNSHKLYTPGPQYLIPFTESDKDEYFKLFNITPKEIDADIDIVLKKINVNADWKLIRNNPIFVVFYCAIRYYTLAKNEKGLNGALAALALSMYPSMFSKYYKFEPNPAVMQYTINTLSNKFTIKKANHIFGNLIMSIQQSWSFHRTNIASGTDKNVVDFIMRIRNDQNSFMRKITGVYMTNHSKNLTIHTMDDSFEDNAVVDVENDTNRVASIADKITMALITNSVDLRLSEAAARGSQVSVIDTRNYLTKIITGNNHDIMHSFIESIIFLYLYTDMRSLNEINTRHFLEFSLSIYKKTNSKDKNILNIKKTLDIWADEIGLSKSTNRSATLINYKRAIYTFFVFSIQKYN